MYRNLDIAGLLLLHTASFLWERRKDMANNNGVITAPVHVSDPQQVLGTTINNVGELCHNAHGLINKWAKYKPVRSTNLGVHGTNWHRGDDGKCGFVLNLKTLITVCNELDIANNLGKVVDWEYEPPYGGLSQPYRLHDFNGYDNKVITIMNKWNMQDSFEVEVDRVDVGTEYVNIRFIGNPNDNNRVNFIDIYSSDIDMKSWYFGIAIRKQGDSTDPIKYITSYSDIEHIIDLSLGFNIKLLIKELTDNKYVIYPFLCNRYWNSDETTLAYAPDKFLTIPNLNAKTLIISDEISIHIVTAGQSALTPSQITMSIMITNNTLNSKTINGIDVAVAARFVGNDFNDSLELGEATETLSNITLAGGETRFISHKFTLNNSHTTRAYNVWLQYRLIKEYLSAPKS